jgi:hypothetical protein
VNVTEATEAPVNEEIAVTTAAPTSEADIEAAISSFRQQLEGQVSVSASVVQDGLLELWGLLPEGDSRTVVERWLTETLERQLYAVTDVDSRLATVLPREG